MAGKLGSIICFNSFDYSVKLILDEITQMVEHGEGSGFMVHQKSPSDS